MCLPNIRYSSVALEPQCSHPHWYLGGISTAADGTLGGMSEKHLGWNLLFHLSLEPGSVLVSIKWWLPMCETRSLCCIPGISAGTCSSVENKAQVEGKHNLSWNKQARRRGGCGQRKGVWEEATRTEQMSSGGRGRGEEMRGSTWAHGMEIPFSPNPMSQLDVGGRRHTCKAAFQRGNTIRMQS